MDDVTFYGSDEEMWDDLNRAMQEADARVRPAQAAIKPGQCFINMTHGQELPIFGEILDYRALGFDNEEQAYINETYEQPHMKYYRPSKAYSVACPMGEIGDIHVSEVSAVIDPTLFDYYREHNWKPPTHQEKINKRAMQLMKEIYPLTYHNDLGILPRAYDPETDTLHLEIMPRSGPKWAEVAYQFAKQPSMKYDKDFHVWGIDGQPRVSYSGLNFVRFVAPFLDGSKVALHIWSEQPSHAEAEEQLGRLYSMFKERDNLEPLEVFKKFL